MNNDFTSFSWHASIYNSGINFLIRTSAQWSVSINVRALYSTHMVHMVSLFEMQE